MMFRTCLSPLVLAGLICSASVYARDGNVYHLKGNVESHPRIQLLLFSPRTLDGEVAGPVIQVKVDAQGDFETPGLQPGPFSFSTIPMCVQITRFKLHDSDLRTLLADSVSSGESITDPGFGSKIFSRNLDINLGWLKYSSVASNRGSTRFGELFGKSFLGPLGAGVVGGDRSGGVEFALCDKPFPHFHSVKVHLVETPSETKADKEP